MKTMTCQPEIAQQALKQNAVEAEEAAGGAFAVEFQRVRRASRPAGSWALQRRLRYKRQAALEVCRGSPDPGEKDTFLLARIIGNDLEPRHRKGQSFDNVLFILDNEPAFEDCEKFWIVNRITDRDGGTANNRVARKPGSSHMSACPSK